MSERTDDSTTAVHADASEDEAAPADLAPEETASVAPRRRPLRVLLIEDNPGDMILIKEMLEGADLVGIRFSGIELEHEDRLSTGLRRLTDESFDLILLDLSLPDCHGIDTFKKTRSQVPDLPIVVLSGLDDEQVALAAVQGGAQDYLVKGRIDGGTLVRSVRYAVERFRYTDELRWSHIRFRKLLAESPEGKVVVDRSGRVLFLNPTAEVLAGDVAPELVGRPLELEPVDGTSEVEVDLGEAGTLRGWLTDTVWEGELARLVSLTDGDSSSRPRPRVAVPSELPDPDERIAETSFEGLVSNSPNMQELFETCVRVAPTRATVLLLGETGTGKELLARAIHKHSGRKGRFVAINCGAVSDTLIESELFGHEKGAFTGATEAKPGLFRHGDKGTILLDEVADLSESAQHSLLRVLQEGAVRPVGGNNEISVDVRVIAATSRPLYEAVREGKFREDLLYRLEVIRIIIPSLRERPEDILHLFSHFCRKLAEQHGVEMPRVGKGFMEAMLSYPWPGNVRQLENFAERLILTAHGECHTARQFHEFVRPYQAPDPAEKMRGPVAEVDGGEAGGGVPRGSDDVDLTCDLESFLERLERTYLEAALRESRGRIQAAADTAGINRRTLLRKLKKYGIRKEAFT